MEADKLRELVAKWRERVKQIQRMYAHPQDYSDTKQEGVGEGIKACADELEAALAATPMPQCNGPFGEEEDCPVHGEEIRRARGKTAPTEPAGGAQLVAFSPSQAEMNYRKQVAAAPLEQTETLDGMSLAKKVVERMQDTLVATIEQGLASAYAASQFAASLSEGEAYIEAGKYELEIAHVIGDYEQGKYRIPIVKIIQRALLRTQGQPAETKEKP